MQLPGYLKGKSVEEAREIIEDKKDDPAKKVEKDT